MVQTSFTTAGRDASINKFIEEVSVALVNGLNVSIYTDFDGTLFPFTKNPEDSKIDEDCFAALQNLLKFPTVSIMGLTGRDVTKAKEMVNGLNFDIIGSHGVECLRADGTLEKYAFDQESNRHIDCLKVEASALTKKFPNIYVEVDKHGSVGINVALVPDLQRDEAYQAALTLLQTFENETFKIALEGQHEMELRPHGFGKDFGIKYFGFEDRKPLTLFMCDSLGEHGTDKVAAGLINNKKEFPQGRVVMVLNGRNQAPSGNDAATPAVVFSSPKDMGLILMGIVQNIQQQSRQLSGSAVSTLYEEPKNQ